MGQKKRKLGGDMIILRIWKYRKIHYKLGYQSIRYESMVRHKEVSPLAKSYSPSIPLSLEDMELEVKEPEDMELEIN